MICQFGNFAHGPDENSGLFVLFVGLFVGGIILGPLAIIFGVIGMKRDGRGMAITGLVCGIVASLFSLLVIAAVLSL